MTGANIQTNGASLEDCHANFFSLTDVCGIKWIVYRENDHPATLDVSEDPVLTSYARCLEFDLLSVWRRVPKRALTSNCSFELPTSGSSSKNSSDDKNVLTQRKELWIFWYGDKPEDLLKKSISSQLKEIPDISGTWENVLPYEARTLLYKALNNLIERNLLSRDFVRLGKWYVQPFDGPERPLQKASHLSFTFHYFVHGESFVCASVDVRQHPAVRRLSMHHLNTARSQSTPVHVVLAPYGLSGSLTGVSYKTADHSVAKLLKDWERFYPLDRNKYFMRDAQGEFVSMPPAVEVVVAGVRFKYPTCYVLVTDIDGSGTFEATSNITKAMHASRDQEECEAMKQAAFSIEPSPFTASNHPLLIHSEFEAVRGHAGMGLESETEHVWQDGLSVNPESTSLNPGSTSDFAQAHNDCSNLIGTHWDFGNPGRLVKKKAKGRTSSKEKSKDRNRFNSKFPFHKKSEALDELAWALDHNEMLGAAGLSSANHGPGHGQANQRSVMRPPGSVRASDSIAHSPASVGAAPTPLASVMTPKGGPGSVRTPGDFSASVASPADKNPATPKSVPPTYPVPSPYPHSDKKPDVKGEFDDAASSSGATATTSSSSYVSSTFGLKSELTTSDLFSSHNDTNSNVTVNLKRPRLPLKEYESGLESEAGSVSDSIYDTEYLQHWLNHPVKKFRPSEQKMLDPLRPMYRRASQSSADQQKLIETVMEMEEEEESSARNSVDPGSKKLVGIKTEPAEFGDAADIKKENKNPDDDKPTDLFTSEGLRPSMDDLDNLFEDSSDETEVNMNMTVPTPPGSNKPPGIAEDTEINFTKLKPSSSLTRSDPTGNLPHDQLAKMFPTPPSHEHNLVASPAEVIESDHLHGAAHIKVEPGSPEAELFDSTNNNDDLVFMLSSSSKFSPLARLYSDELPPINLPPEFRYKPKIPTSVSGSAHSTHGPAHSSGGHSGPNSHSAGHTPLGTPGGKAGMSPISPLTSVEGGPRSHQGPGSVGFQGSSNTGASHDAPLTPSSASGSNADSQVKLPEADALILCLVLSDSLLNLFRDHNFDSCTMCVCSNECNIRGRDAAMYLPDQTSEDGDIPCMCGFSAVINRRLAYHSGLFYEDEAEATGIAEDLYFRKKPSLLYVDSKPNDNVAEKSNVVDGIPHQLLELVQQQSTHNLMPHNSIIKYSKEYLKLAPHPSTAMCVVELRDNNDIVFSALEIVKSAGNADSGKMDETQKQSCIHKWTVLQAPGPYCSEDVIRVMKALQPVLNDAVHVKKSSGSKDQSVLSVQGPLTWRQFHQMAGPSTKGNTDDQCEPLPVPAVTVGHEKDFMSLSPLALHYWDMLSIEPFSQPRDIAYIVVAPDNELLIEHTRRFFKNLSVTYETCRLGRHAPITKILREGILKVGKKTAEKLSHEDTEQWFDLIGDSPTASLVRLYSQVCRHYLLPLLLNLPLDRSLMDSNASQQRQVLVEKTPASPMPPPNMSNHDVNSQNMQGGQNTDPKSINITGRSDSEDVNGKENTYFGCSDTSNDDNGENDVPAVVIYMVDPFSLGAEENSELLRLSCLGLLRSYAQMLPHLSDILRSNIYLQLVSVQSIFELNQSKRNSRMPGMLRGLAFSVYSQAQKPLRYQRDCKTLTGFGSASLSEKYLQLNEAKAKYVSHLHSPAFVLSPPPIKKKSASENDQLSDRGASVLFCNYFLSEDQHWLLASCCDDRGELLDTIIINIEIPNKTRRKRASARRVGLRKLMDWILSVMATALVPWRLVIGRIGRIGHGELRGWSVLLSRKALKRASKELRDMCCWHSDVPSILSACLVSMEPDSNLRLMTDQYTPDERFGQTASNCQLSTPKDASCTHILVFPTSAKAQSSQRTFEDHNDGMISENDLNLGLDDVNLDEIDAGDGIGDIGDFNDLFKDDNWGGGGGQPGSPNSPKRNSVSRANSPGDHMQSQSDQFRYGQEEPGDRIEILQQPLALGYLVSTARTGPMPRWFWSSCPHLENVCPVFLKSALHINVASVLHGGDDGYTPTSASGRVHSLDSNYTADVLRYVLEGYNALSWLSVDHETRDRRSCLPLHVQILLQMYNSLAALF